MGVAVLLLSGLLASAVSKAPGEPPIVRTQPIGRTVTDGGHVTFAVALQPDTAPVRFHWWRNEQPLSDNARVGGSTGSVLNIDPVQGRAFASFGCDSITCCRCYPWVKPITK